MTSTKKNGNSQEAAANIERSISDAIVNLRGKLLKGESIRLTDYAESERAAALAAIATLRDELPIKAKWITLRESHRSLTRLRAIQFVIPGEFLNDGGQQ